MCNLCGSFVLLVYASLYVATALPLLSVLLVAQPTPAVMAAALLKTHAQRRNSSLPSLSRGDVIVPDGTVALRHAGGVLALCASRAIKIFASPAECGTLSQHS